MKEELKAGTVITVENYPFVLESVSLPPDDLGHGGYREVKSWRPGVRSGLVHPNGTLAVCDGFGKQI